MLIPNSQYTVYLSLVSLLSQCQRQIKSKTPTNVILTCKSTRFNDNTGVYLEKREMWMTHVLEYIIFNLHIKFIIEISFFVIWHNPQTNFNKSSLARVVSSSLYKRSDYSLNKLWTIVMDTIKEKRNILRGIKSFNKVFFNIFVNCRGFPRFLKSF